MSREHRWDGRLEHDGERAVFGGGEIDEETKDRAPGGEVRRVELEMEVTRYRIEKLAPVDGRRRVGRDKIEGLTVWPRMAEEKCLSDASATVYQCQRRTRAGPQFAQSVARSLAVNHRSRRHE